MFSAGPGDHAVAFHEEHELAALVGGYLSDAISGGGSAVLVATPQHRSQVTGWLSRSGIDLARPWSDGSYVLLDAGETLSRFMINGQPDAAAFWETMSPVLAAASRKAGPVRVFGQIVAELWGNGMVDAAIEVEALWNEMIRQYHFALLCAYPALTVNDEANSDSLAQVCCAHTALVGAAPGAVEAWLPG